jgi:hypothetical protein
MTNPAQQTDQLQRVISAIQGTATLPELKPGRAAPTGWQRWWELRGIAFVSVGVGLLLVLVSWLAWTLRPDPQPTAMPSGNFNIAVAELRATDAEGNPVSSKETDDLSNSIANFISSQTDVLGEIIGETVMVWGPDKGITYVTTGEEAKRVELLNADTLVYGDLREQRNGRWYIEPKFYLTTRAVGQAYELLGEHGLGAEIEYRPGVQASKRDVNATLRLRMQALTQVLLGLSYYTFGDLDGYQKATEAFLAAVDDPVWGESARGAGQEVLYLFLGNAYLKSASVTDSFEDYTYYLTESRNAYEKAIALNPDYVRSYNGLGSVLSAIALRSSEECDWDWATLEKAIEVYNRALEAPEVQKSPSGYVDLRAHLGLGRSYYWLGYCTLGKSFSEGWQKAQAHHQMVVRMYRVDPQPYLRLETSLAYLDLADMAFIQAKRLSEGEQNDSRIEMLFKEAADYYQQGLDLATAIQSDEGDYLAETIVSQFLNLLCHRGQIEQAKSIFDNFITDADDPVAVRATIIDLTKEECNDAAIFE